MHITDIFYILMIFPLSWEALKITNIKRCHFFLNLINNKLSKENEIIIEGKTIKLKSTYDKKESIFIICNYLYMVYDVIGIFSSQSIIFCILCIMAFIPNSKNILVMWIDSFITFLILVFILFNIYYLHINFWELIKNLI